MLDRPDRPRPTLYRTLSAHRRTVALGSYALATALAFFSAYLLRFEFQIPGDHLRTFLVALPLLLVIRALGEAAFQVTTSRWRFAGVRDAVRLGLSTLAASAVFWALLLFMGFDPSVPRSVILMELVLSANLKAGMWVLYRLERERRTRRDGGASNDVPALVVGAGVAGGRLVREMMAGGTGYAPVGFVDDDRLKQGTAIEGIRVLGSVEELARIAENRRARAIIVAIPSASTQVLREIVHRAQEANLPVRVLPAMSEVLSGESGVNHLRDVRIEDLLGREPVHLELPELARDLEGKVVLITGAAGSIGSELARQVALHRPRRLILLDQAESPLYFVELELRERHPALELVPVVGDILDQASLERVFLRQRPERVFHAAAYKHVPLMECNPLEAVRNNVVGTWRVAELSGRIGVERFVLISTDKAVRPSSIMGSTKRLAELTLLGARDRFPRTWFTAVRFGNVLGSQGSVIPLFRKQLETTRRLTVTHEDVSRYFMTIPEAVQLVLQASTLEEARGRIAMLEMGEPVKIMDLAKNLIRLAGLREGVDAHIAITGMRPGEKMHEELVGEGEETFETRVERVRVVGNSSAGLTPGPIIKEILALEERLEELDPVFVGRELDRLVRRCRLQDLRHQVPYRGDGVSRGMETERSGQALGAD